MTPRQPFPAFRQRSARAALPGIWLFTDARLGDDLRRVIAACPPRAGIIFRHDHLSKRARACLFRAVRRAARARRMKLMGAGTPAAAARSGAGGVHLRRPTAAAVRAAHARGLAVSAPVHDRGEAAKAARAGVDLVFVSPVFATRSHAGAAPLGTAHAARLMRTGGTLAVPLGGMTPARARALHRRVSAHGAIRFAAIDHWLEKAGRRRTARQKRNCVPT